MEAYRQLWGSSRSRRSMASVPSGPAPSAQMESGGSSSLTPPSPPGRGGPRHTAGSGSPQDLTPGDAYLWP